MNVAKKLPEPMERSLNNFITKKLHEYGWLSACHDNEELRRAIIESLLEPRSRHFQGHIPAILVKQGTQIAVAEVLCTTLLKDTPPSDEDVLSFTWSLVDLYHDLCFNQCVWSGALSLGFMGNGGTPSHDSVTMLRTGRRLSFFTLPAEVREMVYKEYLISPEGSVVRSFTQPPLFQANRMVRDEAIPIFYGKNHFEITIKRTPEYERLAGNNIMPSVDSWMWHRFLRMWDVFNQNGSNCLHYVERITVIYQLSLNTGSTFGKDEFDKRVGFRLSYKPFEEDADGDYEEDGDSESASDNNDDDSDDDSNNGSDVDPDELQAEVNSLDDDDAHEHIGYQTSSVNQGRSPEKDFDPVGVFELKRDSFFWGSRQETQMFLFNHISTFRTGRLWVLYPIRRLTDMLWRCVRNCPRVANNVDFLCEDYQYWMSDTRRPYTGYDSRDFYDPDDEEEQWTGSGTLASRGFATPLLLIKGSGNDLTTLNMRHAFRSVLVKSIAGRNPRTLRARPSPPGSTSGHGHHENTRRRLSQTSRTAQSENDPTGQRDGAKFSRFSRLVDLVEDNIKDDQTLVAGSNNHQTEVLREALRNAPLFSSAACNSVESVIDTSPTEKRDTELISQYGLVGALQNVDINDDAEQMKADIQDRLVLANLDRPWSSFIYGSKGSGKSHTLACLLENALMLKADADANMGDGNGSSAGEYRGPPAAIMLHYNNYADSAKAQPCQAAILSANRTTPVTVLVSGSNSNIWAMEQSYDELLPRWSPRPRVVPLYLYDRQLTTDRMLRLMAVKPTGSEPSTGLPYMGIVRGILDDMALSDSKFAYARFRERLDQKEWTIEQREGLDSRLKLLERFMEPKFEWLSPAWLDASQDMECCFQPGSLTIVDLSDPFLDPEDAFALFSIALSIFMERTTRCGRIVAMDDAERFLAQTAESTKFTRDLMSVMRQQRHTNTHVMIATQEPARCPELMDLSDTIFIHKMLAPDQLTALQQHIHGAHDASKPRIETSGTHERQLCDRVAGLQTGESLVVCPTARLAVENGQEGVSSSNISVPPLGGDIAKVRVRRRPTTEWNRAIMGGQTNGSDPAPSAGEELLVIHALTGNDPPIQNDANEQDNDSDWDDDFDDLDIGF